MEFEKYKISSKFVYALLAFIVQDFLLVFFRFNFLLLLFHCRSRYEQEKSQESLKSEDGIKSCLISFASSARFKLKWEKQKKFSYVFNCCNLIASVILLWLFYAGIDFHFVVQNFAFCLFILKRKQEKTKNKKIIINHLFWKRVGKHTKTYVPSVWGI